MLAHTVVIGSDRAGSHVDVLAEAGVTDVAEVVDLAAGTHLAFLHLHKVADAASIGDVGRRTQMSKGSDGNAIAHRGLPDNGMQHGDIAAELGILQQAVGSVSYTHLTLPTRSYV